MNYKVETLPDSPVLVATMGKEFQVKRDLNALIDEVTGALDAAPQPMYVIDDTREMALSFGDMVTALGAISKGTALVSHPNIRKIIFVTTSDMVRLGGTALRQTQYGARMTDVVATLEAALALIQAEAAVQ